MRNARFWTWMNDGWVKITLSPGETLAHYVSRETEEGWSGRLNSWKYDSQDGTIECTVASEGQDCDGRTSYHCTSYTTLEQLRENVIDSSPEDRDEKGNAILAPRWEQGERVCYDQFAEQAGY